MAVAWRYSVVIPAFNEADSLARVVAAVAGLPGPVEVIVVDDGSTDGTAEEIARGVVFLSSPASSFTTGTNLVIDGALTKGVQL